MHFTYLIILLLTLAYPLLRSFENKIEYYYKWKYLFPAIILSAVIFIPWTIWFKNEGIWEYNSNFILGTMIKKLPLEQWLFFLIIPFASVYIYEVMNFYIKKDILGNLSILITILLSFLLFSFAIIYNDKAYTFSTFLSLGALLITHLILKSKYLGRFYVAFGVCLVPFFIINGFISGLPIVTAIDYENMAVRIFTIPVEDVFFWMLNFLTVITFFEWIRPSR